MAEVSEDFFFKLADEILVMIFQRLPVPDLLRSTLVCKRFNKVLGPGEFWKTYVQSNYNFDQVNRGKAKHKLTEYNLDALAKNWYCFWDNSNAKVRANDKSRFVFRPFPKMLASGIIVPSDFAPLDKENVFDYFAFNRALYLLLKLRQKCQYFQVTSSPYYSDIDSVLDFCLFPWQGEDLPKPQEVLEVFNVHQEIIRMRSEDQEGIHLAERLEFEPEEYFDEDTEYDRDITLLNNTFSQICQNEGEQKEFYEWVQKLFQPSLMFHAGKDAIHPQLYFHLTFLAPGWVGGVFTTISLV